MRLQRPLIVIAAAALAASTLASCSQGGGDELTYEDSPLSEYFGAADLAEQSEEEMQAEAEAQEREVEDAVAACMQDEGFEYIPNPAQVSVGGSDDVVWEPDSRDWVEQYGYGIFNDPWMDQNGDESVDEGEYEEHVDPNQDYVEALSDSEREAYERTLWGEEVPEEAYDDPDFDYNSVDRGCYGTASDEVYGSSAVYDEFEPLMDKMNELYEQVQSSDQMVELDAAWASCMADAGFPGYRTQVEASDAFYEKQNAFWEEQEEIGADLDWETATEEEIAEYDRLLEESDPSGTPEWEAAGEEEIKTALADLDCREETDYNDESLKAQFALEEQFIADNEAELEAFRAAMEQAG